MAQQDPKKSDEQLAAEKAAAEKAASDADAAAKPAPPPAKKPEFVVAPDQSIVTHSGEVVDAGCEVKPTDFHMDPKKSRVNFDDLVARGAIVKG